MTTSLTPWTAALSEIVYGYRRMIDAAVAQLSDEELFRRPAPDMNSVAILLRHLGGNLRSRWTDFLTTDGEKPDRQRDTEFEEWEGDRASLLAHFDAGWRRLVEAIESITDANVTTEIAIRGEPHSVPQALLRSVTHVAYHTGQIVMVARDVHGGSWRWLTIAPGGSEAHNAETWGDSSSRGVFGGEDE